MRTRTGITLALVAATMWGIAGVLAAAVFTEVSVIRVAEVRAVAGALAFLPYVIWKGEVPDRHTWRWVIAFGVSLATVTYSFYLAIDLIGVGPGATIQFIAPVYLLAWNRWVRGDAVPAVAWMAAGVALVGVALVAQAFEGAALNLPGLAAGITSSIAFAFYLALAERLSRNLSSPAIMAYGFGVAALIWLVAVPIWTFPTDLSATAWWQLAAVIVIGTIVPFALEIKALGMAPAPLIGLTATWEPLVATVLAWAFLAQQLTLGQALGAVMILGAISLIQRNAGEHQPELIPAT
jgi:drug/metabolite transporter (DMT)-like permease